MRLLLTRPEEDGAAFAARLVAHGHEAVLAPLSAIEFLAGPPLDLSPYDGVLATSANGVRALARRTRARVLPVLAVGPHTEHAARRAGFSRVECAHGDARALCRAIPKFFAATAKLVYAAGCDARPLEAPGYAIERIALYRMIAAKMLPATAAEALRAKTLDGVCVFSPASAAVFAALVRAAGLDGCCAGLDAYCISEAAAKSLTPLKFAHFCIAPRPDGDALLDILPVSRAGAKTET